MQKTLLAVLAHPDDESFGMGGTLALYAQQGAAVYLVCATRGEVGDVDEQHLTGYTHPYEVREAELRCAARKLGLAGVYFLGYRDSGMPGSPDNNHPEALAAAPLEEVVAKVVYYIRKLKPQVVLTFDPIGGYRHPDHIAIHNATVRAFEVAGDPTYVPPISPKIEADLFDDLSPHQPDKLYFQVLSRQFLKLAVRFMPLFGKDPRRWGRNGDIDLTSLAEVEFPVHAKINFRPVKELKEEASLCHSSQGGPAVVRGLMGWIMRMGGATETYMRAVPPPVNGKIERDLFNGIEQLQASRSGRS